jgi:hypothetical protein
MRGPPVVLGSPDLDGPSAIAFRGPDRLRPGQAAQNSGASVTFSPSSSAVNGIWQERREFSWT